MLDNFIVYADIKECLVVRYPDRKGELLIKEVHFVEIFHEEYIAVAKNSAIKLAHSQILALGVVNIIA